MNSFQLISRELGAKYKLGLITYSELNAGLAVMFTGMTWDEVITFKLE